MLYRQQSIMTFITAFQLQTQPSKGDERKK